jgi:UDP-N-acetylmuramoyl-tripeptide--D-alanyl-D-alanine ligase
MNTAQLYQLYLQYPSVQTDTRKLQKGDIFFALKGDNFNGNHFAVQAIEAGAAWAVVDEVPPSTGSGQALLNDRMILVSDVLTALQQLAGYHRQQFNIPFLAITGSNGKTTTKELIHAVLSTALKTYTTEGNLNNHIGVPLTLLKIKPDAQMAVIEMGANHLREIAGYCTYAQPTHGIITNAGKAHLEGFGGLEGVRKGKGELFDHLRSHNGTAFIMADYDYLHGMSKGIREVITYGTHDASLTGIAEKSEPFLSVRITHGTTPFTIHTQLVGAYNLPNVLAAVAVGNYFGVPVEKIQKAIESYAPSNSRSQLIEQGSNRIVLDAYNANPSSMKAAIENFAALDAPNKVLMLGGMAELGSDSMAEHQAIVDLIGQYKWKQVVLVGGDFLRLHHPYTSFDNAAGAGEWLRQQSFHDTALLIKGSRSMQMEKVLAAK